MESCSLQSPSLVSSLSRNGLIEKPSGYSQILNFSNLRRHHSHSKLVRKLRFTDFRVQSSGTLNVRSEAVGVISKKEQSKDVDLVFVAGATGRVGSRTVRELLKLGFRVRAGVRSAQRAENLVQSVKQMKLNVENASEGTQPVEKLEIVECDLEKRDRILPALGNASVVICCIGASEKEIFDITGPYRIDYQATENLVNAATAAKVNHFILLTSLGTNKVGFPAAILNLFWGVLIWKRKAEEALLASGLPYTIVRPGGMERPTDTYKETHNITLSQEDTLFGGQVSNLQVAELMACMAKNRSLSYCKVVEVIAETTAPLTPMEQLLAKIPSQRAEPKEPSVVDKSEPTSSKSVVSEKPSAPIEKEPPQAKPKAVQSLSPYTAYDDLKPPTSPTPTPSTRKKEVTVVDGVSKPSITETVSSREEVWKTRPLSPYAAYEDLKPPTSPSPTPSGPREITLSASTPVEAVSPVIGGNDVAKPPVISVVTVVEDFPSGNSTFHHSPFYMYEDLKPPTSPTPSPRKS
ncbi:hypothetical protein EZV62_011477 [Acer yangbiense]|uniref:NAD(P)-binding domain-containing protein n=1 Tax=Acer yangbiense TaxID=1000413 RepID=A0A5C7I4M2_9ROSI|nr:hypothetical protein EZV62_011477 [Acer yangbiense]